MIGPNSEIEASHWPESVIASANAKLSLPPVGIKKACKNLLAAVPKCTLGPNKV